MIKAPLEGLRVLDFSGVLAGPFATQQLADLGADVIKVEDTNKGDTMRGHHPFVNGESAYFLAINRNKRAISINLRHPDGHDIARRLAARSDVVIENFRPATVDRLGLGYGTLAAENPALVYCSISEFGASGPLRDKLASDLIVQAMTGAMDITGEEGGPPLEMGLPAIELSAGLYACIAVLAALERRRRTGAGCHLDISMFDVGVALLSYMAQIYLLTGAKPKRLGTRHPNIFPYKAFETKDGYIVIAAFTQAFWHKYCRAIGHPELADKQEFATFQGRLDNREQLDAILSLVMKQRSSAEWLAIMDDFDVPNGPLNSIAEALSMEQTHARDMVAEMQHPSAGSLPILGTPFRFAYSDGTRFIPSFAPAPRLGEHSARILMEQFAIGREKIARLVAHGIVRILA